MAIQFILAIQGEQWLKEWGNILLKDIYPKECYKNVCVIEYMKHKTKSDAQVWEVYLINKYKPKFNKLNKKDDALTIDLGEENWKVYQVLNRQAEKVKYKCGCLSYVLIASLIYVIYYLLSR